MRYFYLSYFLTIASSMGWPTLPSFKSVIFMVGIGIVLSLKSSQTIRYVCAGMILALLWGTYHYQSSLSHRLSVAQAGNTFDVIGVIESIVSYKPHLAIFKFNIKDYDGIKDEAVLSQLPEHIKLSWYNYDASVPLKPGQLWALKVKLKPPIGVLNQYGFDFEKSALANRIDATGYIKQPKTAQYLQQTGEYRLQQWRQTIYEYLKTHLSLSQSGILIALLLGIREGIPNGVINLFQHTGTLHLLAISGLHIALVGGMVFKLSLRLIKQVTPITQYIPADKLAAIFAIFAAVSYSALAGFAIPTQRACIMFTVWLLPRFINRPIRASDRLLFGVFLITLYDPSAVLSAGFWLSACAVGIILYASSLPRKTFKLQSLVHTQGLVWLGLLPLSLLFFQQVSIASLGANLIAIPIVSIILLPMTLIAFCMLFVLPSIGQYCFSIANAGFETLMQLLQYFNQFPNQLWQPTLPQGILWGSLFMACIVLSLPRGWPLKSLALVSLCAIFWPAERLQSGDIKLQVLDVGQALSVLVKTKQHALLYDAGGRHLSGWNAGDSIILPNLIAQGVNRLDTLMISHRDLDHRGGVAPLLKQFDINEISLGERIPELKKGFKQCKAGQHWVWDKVNFEILSPRHLKARRNNRSCVLRVSNGTHSILFTGDIEQPAEAELLMHSQQKLKSDILIAPHHGSKTSSTAEFISAVSPKQVVFSAGFLNRYHLPHPSVVHRYQQQGATLLNTAKQGALTWYLKYNKKLTVPKAIRDVKRFWRRSNA